MLTPAQIRAQVSAIRKRVANGAHAFAIHAPSGWTGPDHLEVAGEEHKVVACRSDLQVREALLRSEAERHPCILLCEFDPAHLADDVLARLAKRRVFHPQASEVLAELFGARVIDPRVLGCKPLVEALTVKAPKDGYRPVSGGSLDLQTAWLALLETVFEQKCEGPSLTSILAWSLDERRLRAFRELSQALREAMAEWFVRSRGEAVRFMLSAVESGAGQELVPLGLLTGLLFQPQCRGTPEAQVALGRLERYFSHREIDEASARAWAAAAEEFLQERAVTDSSSVRPLLVGLDNLLEQTRVTSLARFSRFSPTGLENRFEAAGAALASALQSKGPEALQSALAALKEVETHFLAAENTARTRRVGMALRLLAWLRTAGEPAPQSGLSQLSDYYLREGGFVDWARDNLEESDPVGSLREAYQEILRQVDLRFGAFEQAFVTSLQRWFAEGSPSAGMLPIEDVLGEFVCPTVREHPVLLLVLDGMSVAAFRQLLDDLVRRDWVELTHARMGFPRPVAATLPSTTEVSRWALLAGRLEEDRRGTEKMELGRNQRLLEVLGSQSKPLLFVKADLTAAGQLGLAPEVQAAILNRRNRMVAVVVNAMDDLLGAGDQVAVSWGIDSIKPLRELLHVARDSERVVLVTSDHGHVLDRNSRQLPTDVPDVGDRYRAARGSLSDGELEFKGRRVQQAMGPAGVICLTKRDFRYQSKKRGYHGGACVQEVVVPLAALRHLGTPLPDGWQDLPPFQPAWWDIRPPTGEAPPVLPRAVAGRPRVVPKPVSELDLFGEAGQEQVAATGDWLTALLASELYREQMRRAARIPRLQEEVPRLLRALGAHGNSMLRSALAQELGLPLFRIDGLVQNAGRILNLDGYEAIAYDRAAETIALNLELLKSQFGVGG
jgi:hypothetical protein